MHLIMRHRVDGRVTVILISLLIDDLEKTVCILTFFSEQNTSNQYTKSATEAEGRKSIYVYRNYKQSTVLLLPRMLIIQAWPVSCYCRPLNNNFLGTAKVDFLLKTLVPKEIGSLKMV
jgi:hypothetical protein